MKNIVLIGMMGCGKSTCGARLAQKLGRTWVDTDTLIEERRGMSVAEIFKREGEESFRGEELALARELGGREDLVISCGGGLPMQEGCMQALGKSGTVVFLERDPAEIYAGVSMADRPLGQDGEAAFLARYRKREPVYRRWADAVVPVGRTPEETLRAVMEAIEA